MNKPGNDRRLTPTQAIGLKGVVAISAGERMSLVISKFSAAELWPATPTPTPIVFTTPTVRPYAWPISSPNRTGNSYQLALSLEFAYHRVEGVTGRLQARPSAAVNTRVAFPLAAG